MMIEKPNISGCNLSRDMSENTDGKGYEAFEASDENIDTVNSVESMEYGETMDNIKTENCSLFSSIPLHKFEVRKMYVMMNIFRLFRQRVL